MILYRPVALQELELIYDSGMKAFPARLPQQPIFYPVLDLAHARQTASDWNVRNGKLAGYVTQFKVEDEYIDKFEEHTVGESGHKEFWIPAEEMDEFNLHISGHIKVVEAHFGKGFKGYIPDQFGLQGKNAVEQFTLLSNSYVYKRMDFYLEIKRNHKAVFLNYPFWHKHEFKNPGLKEKILQAIREAWLTSFPKTPLPVPDAEEILPPVQPASKSATEGPSNRGTNSATKQVPNQGPKTTTHINTIKGTNVPINIEPNSLTRPPDEETESYSFEEFEEQTEPEDNKDPEPPVRPAAAKNLPAPIKDKPLLPKPPQEEKEPEKKVPPPPPVGPARRDVQPSRHSGFPFLAKPKQETPRPVQPIESNFARGVRSGLSGNYSEAVEELTRSVRGNPDRVVAHTSLGVALHKLGQDDRALASYDAALKLDPRNAEAYYFKANILYERGEDRQAIDGYTLAVGLNPELIDAHQKDVPQDRLTDYSPTPAGLYSLARAAHQILDLNRALEKDPRQAQLLKERAAGYARLQNYEQAITDYTAALAIQPDDAHLHHLRGLAYEQAGQVDLAMEDYQRANSIHPQLADVYLNRGVALGKMGNFRQSIASLNEAVRLSPRNPDAYFNRGATLIQLGDFENAVADFSMVIQLSPKDEDAYYWRGISHEESGRLQEAIEDYKRFVTISNNPEARAQIEQKLGEWNVIREANESRHRVVAEERKKLKTEPSEKPEQGLDLHALLVPLGKRVEASFWFVSGVKCKGERAGELLQYSDSDQPIEGLEFLHITSGIRKTIEGDYQAVDPGATTPWLFIRAWNGNGFYIETNDPGIRKRLQANFPSLEEVEGAMPPYESFFIST